VTRCALVRRPQCDSRFLAIVIPTLRKRREGWGTLGGDSAGEFEHYRSPHFSQKTREMGHPAGRPQRLKPSPISLTLRRG
jgi:hypothetical protein